jgi:hypothetical protein
MLDIRLVSFHSLSNMVGPEEKHLDISNSNDSYGIFDR